VRDLIAQSLRLQKKDDALQVHPNCHNDGNHQRHVTHHFFSSLVEPGLVKRGAGAAAEKSYAVRAASASIGTWLAVYQFVIHGDSALCSTQTMSWAAPTRPSISNAPGWMAGSRPALT
jgi:hypothetical protein